MTSSLIVWINRHKWWSSKILWGFLEPLLPYLTIRVTWLFQGICSLFSERLAVSFCRSVTLWLSKKCEQKFSFPGAFKDEWEYIYCYLLRSVYITYVFSFPGTSAVCVTRRWIFENAYSTSYQQYCERKEWTRNRRDKIFNQIIVGFTNTSRINIILKGFFNPFQGYTPAIIPLQTPKFFWRFRRYKNKILAWNRLIFTKSCKHAFVSLRFWSACYCVGGDILSQMEINKT